MKRSVCVLAALMVAGATGMRAQDSGDARPVFSAPERYARVGERTIDRAYARLLASGNDGVAESAIAQCVSATMALPEARFNNIRAALGSLAVNGRTASIRYKAYLAGLVLDNPSMVAGTSIGDFRNSQELFTALSGRLQSLLIGANDRKYVRPE